MPDKKLDYHETVNYDIADPAKVLAQKEGLETRTNMPYGFSEVEGTRGESAYVFDMGGMYGALVQEGLGTKSLIAQSVYKETGESHFAAIAQDTVATVINDLISVGARPVVMNAYWSSSSYDWLADKDLTEDFIQGWRRACDSAGVVWGGGETQALSGVVSPGALEFAGSGFGVIKDKKRLISDADIEAGDRILLVESSGVHANGISLAREIAAKLKLGYRSPLPDGQTFGEALLQPTRLYAELIDKLFEADVDVHYLSNITGHGWRKLMRGRPQLTYEMDFVPQPQAVFDFIGQESGNGLAEMYGNYNMGAGYAIYLPADAADEAIRIAAGLGLKAWDGGQVKKGPKRVVIKPLGIEFDAGSLGVRA